MNYENWAPIVCITRGVIRDIEQALLKADKAALQKSTHLLLTMAFAAQNEVSRS